MASQVEITITTFATKKEGWGEHSTVISPYRDKSNRAKLQIRGFKVNRTMHNSKV